MREAHNSQFTIQNSKLKIATARCRFPLNSKEGTLSSDWRGPESGQLRKIVNKDAETTSYKPP